MELVEIAIEARQTDKRNVYWYTAVLTFILISIHTHIRCFATINIKRDGIYGES